jgi:hypothetical protein
MLFTKNINGNYMIYSLIIIIITQKLINKMWTFQNIKSEPPKHAFMYPKTMELLLYNYSFQNFSSTIMVRKKNSEYLKFYYNSIIALSLG